MLPLATGPALRSASRPSTAVYYGSSSAATTTGSSSSSAGAAGGSGSGGGSGVDDDDGTGGGGGEQWGTMVLGLSQHPVASVDDIMALLQRGARNRIVRTTQANDMSSRSHTILQMQVTVTEEGAPAVAASGGVSGSAAVSASGAPALQRRVRTARLTLVDLAGSERCA